MDGVAGLIAAGRRLGGSKLQFFRHAGRLDQGEQRRVSEAKAVIIRHVGLVGRGNLGRVLNVEHRLQLGTNMVFHARRRGWRSPWQQPRERWRSARRTQASPDVAHADFNVGEPLLQPLFSQG